MTKEEINLFNRLCEIRSKGADLLDEPFMSGVKTGTIEKYSDQAHFIYELLQNADDVSSTKCHFDLYEDKLVFIHNGTKKFTLSDPENEKIDKINGKLGDINAITSIGNSSKNIEAKIGKFGVGFKAVFQYTSTPHIYDPNIKFKIERFIVPVLLDDDYSERKTEETVFVFPFDNPKTSASIAVEDIFDKMQKLVLPILFLNNLTEISYSYNRKTGSYKKKLVEKRLMDNTDMELFKFDHINDGKVTHDRLWLFSRKNEENFKYSVGFFIDEKNKLIGREYPAFCYFPTKEKTGLNFIIHAPFLLTDSREGIRAANMHNCNLIDQLADLAGKSLVYLRDLGLEKNQYMIDDSVFDVIPYKDNFADLYSKSEISFKPFYTKIKEVFLDEKIIPARNGYSYSKESFWALYPPVSELLSDEQLSYMFGKENAKWVFASFGRYETNRTNRELSQYIENIISRYLDDEEIFRRINSSFVEKYGIEWLLHLYEYIGERTNRIESAKKYPIFLDSNGKATAAFDNNDEEILFLSSSVSTDLKVINQDLYKYEVTKKLVKAMGLSEPSLKNEIYNQILPLYDEEGDLDTEEHFMKFFAYYKECAQTDIDKFIELIKDKKFVSYYSQENKEVYRGEASTIYYPSEFLKRYFASKKNTRFLGIEEYSKMIQPNEEKILLSFFKEIGIAFEPRIIKYYYSTEEVKKINRKWERSTWYSEWFDYRVDGLVEAILSVTNENKNEVSTMVWNQLVESNKKLKIERKNSNIFRKGFYRYYFRQEHKIPIDSLQMDILTKTSWIMNKEGNLVAPETLTWNELNNLYNVSDDDIDEIYELLNIKPLVNTEYSENLSKEDQLKIALADELFAAGIKADDIKEFKEYILSKRATDMENQHDSNSIELDNSITEKTKNVIKNIANKVTNKENEEKDKLKNKQKEPFDEEEIISNEEDEYIRPTVDYKKKIEQAQEKSALEIAKITQLEELQEQVENSKKYSCGWFKSLLQLEMFSTTDNAMNNREVSITFGKIEKEENTNRVYILKHPNRYIPAFMEDLSDIPMVIQDVNQTFKVTIEVASVRGYSLRVKIKPNEQIETVDLTMVKSISIEAKNPGFILAELINKFNDLGYDDDFDLQENLCENIKFIFGPPGTGKTTHLAKDVIIPLTKDDVKILVLTPTNKAADVLTSRIMEIAQNNDYKNWLMRFGLTNEEKIEQSGVFRERSTDIRKFSKSVVVTTIARFPYDYFMTDNNRIFLNGINWDYIIVDEASMIPLVNIIYPLYRKTPKQFIIAGDPFQIEPITAVDYWKDENIYTMVELNSFDNPQTIPYTYEVELLTTQYRSTPSIGRLFSKFSYGGILNHFRSEESKKELNMEEFIDVSSVNILKFPVQKYESIYKAKKLHGSSNYHIYSAIFTYEMIVYMSKIYSKNEPEKKLTIGIIAPYRAQSDLIEKLLSTYDLPANVDVQVGTIHGFQGDECDMIFAVFNPPPYISDSPNVFLNKRNIINVSISRARDYLFIVMPDENTDKVSNLKLLGRIEKLCKEENASRFDSSEIEKIIFNNDKYIEDNSFSTTHQIVNVYGLPEMKYEIRSEESAVDIQVHKDSK